MTKTSLVILVFMFCVSCSNKQHDTHGHVMLELEKIDIGTDASLYEMVAINDSMLIATQLSNAYKLIAIDLDSPDRTEEFVSTGRGPFDVMNVTVKQHDDTIHILSHGPHGLLSSLRIGIDDIHNKKNWKSTNYSDLGQFIVGTDFTIVGNNYIVLGDYLRKDNILSYIGIDTPSYTQVGFWPDDDFDGTNIPKQSIYRGGRLYSHDGKLLYSCNEGRYATILTFDQGNITEKKIYENYPSYSSKDGLNWSRNHHAMLGCYAYANQSRIYLSPIEATLSGDHYIPEDNNGYPPYYNNTIDVIDWDGNYIQTYESEIPFYNFIVSEDCLTIYLLSTDPTTGLSALYKCPLF